MYAIVIGLWLGVPLAYLTIGNCYTSLAIALGGTLTVVLGKVLGEIK